MGFTENSRGRSPCLPFIYASEWWIEESTASRLTVDSRFLLLVKDLVVPLSELMILNLGL